MRVRSALALLCFYGVLVVWCTWPLGAHLTTHLPDTSNISRIDLRLIVWALSWETYALTTDPSRFFEANSFHPTPHVLLYSEPAYGALPWFMPTMIATGNPILAANVMFLGSIVLTVWGLHLLVRHWTGLDSAAFVAAGTLLTSRWLMVRWGAVAPNYAVLQYYPPIIALAASQRLAGWRAGLLALLVALQGVVSPYVAAPVVVTLGVLAGGRLLRAGTRRDAWRLLAAVASGAAVIALAYLPNLWWLRHLEPEISSQSWWRMLRRVRADFPLGSFVGVFAPTRIALPLLAIVVCGIGMRLVRSGPRPAGEAIAWRHGLLWTGVGLALMLTPRVSVFGHPVTLPHAVLMDHWPGLDLLRSTERLGIGGLFGLAILAGAGFTEIARASGCAGPARLSRSICAVLAGVVVGSSGQRWADMARFARVPPTTETLSAGTSPAKAESVHHALQAFYETTWEALGPWRSYAVVDATTHDSPVRDVLRQPGGPLVVIELFVPLQAVFSADRHRVNAQAMFESIGTWRPLLNGYGGFYPKDYPARMGLAQSLPDPAALRQLRNATGVELVLVRGAPGHPKMQAWERLASRGGGDGLALVARAGDELLFRVTPPR